MVELRIGSSIVVTFLGYDRATVAFCALGGLARTKKQAAFSMMLGAPARPTNGAPKRARSN